MAYTRWQANWQNDAAGGTPIVEGFLDQVESTFVSMDNRLSQLSFNVKDYGALGDGTTNDTTSIQSAITAAGSGGIVFFPAGTYRVAGIVINTSVHLRGAGYTATILKLVNSVNTDVIVSSNFATNTGTNGAGGPFSFSISDLSIDGNSANNLTSGYGIRLYGRDFLLRNLRVFSCRNDGIYTEWGTGASIAGVNDAMECVIDNVKSHNNAGWGFNINGPHDGMALNCISYVNTLGGFQFSGNANGFLARQCHSWGTQPIAVKLAAGNVKWDLSEAETDTSNTCILILSNDCQVTGGGVFDPTNSSTVGIEIGDGTHTPAGVVVDTSIRGCLGAALKFTNSGGFNWCRAVVYQISGTIVTGSPQSTDVIDIPTPNGAAALGTLPANGSLTRNVVRTNYFAHRKAFPDPGGSTGWYKLGTWTTGFSGSRLILKAVGTSKYDASTMSVGQTWIVLSTGDATVSPNISGYFESEGGAPLLTGVKCVANGGVGTGLVWDIWANVAVNTGNSFVQVETGTETKTSSWAWVLTSGADPGAASTTIAVLTRIGSSIPLTTFKSGSYFYGTIGLSTSATLGNGTLRMAPMWLSGPVGITAVGAEFTVAGDAASLLRMVIYYDDGTSYPGALALDCGSISTGTGNAGTVATAGTPGVYMNTLGSTLSLPAGMYWVGGAVQGVTTTQPTIRVAQFMNFSPGGTAVPGAGAVVSGYNNTGITGAPPATFVTFGTNAGGIGPRIIFRLA